MRQRATAGTAAATAAAGPPRQCFPPPPAHSPGPLPASAPNSPSPRLLHVPAPEPLSRWRRRRHRRRRAALVRGLCGRPGLRQVWSGAHRPRAGPSHPRHQPVPSAAPRVLSRGHAGGAGHRLPPVCARAGKVGQGCLQAAVPLLLQVGWGGAGGGEAAGMPWAVWAGGCTQAWGALQSSRLHTLAGVPQCLPANLLPPRCP